MNADAIKILLVEDSEEDAQLVRQALLEVQAPRFDLTHCVRLARALECIDAERFDAVLLDLQLPDAWKLEAVERLQKSAPDLPIVVLTGQADDQLAIAAMRAGTQDYISKAQMNGELLARTLRYSIERQHLRGQLRRAQEQLLAAERQRVLDQTAGGAAHEINQPLTTLITLTQLLAMSLPPESPLLEPLESMAETSMEINAIVRSLGQPPREEE